MKKNMKESVFTRDTLINYPLKTGDIYFLRGKGFISKAIKFFTGGPISHVGIVYDTYTVFETDGAWGKARFFSINKYIGSNIEFFRQVMIDDVDRKKISDLCKKYEGTPYSYWDCFTNAVFSVFNSRIRHTMTSLLGTKKFAKCDEMTQMIIFKGTGYMPFENYESSNPSEMYDYVSKSIDFEKMEWEGEIA